MANRTVWKAFRCTAEEAAEISEQAERNGLSESDYMRRKLFWLPPDTDGILRELKYCELGIGADINRMAWNCNSENFSSDLNYQLLTESLEKIARQRSELTRQLQIQNDRNFYRSGHEAEQEKEKQKNEKQKEEKPKEAQRKEEKSAGKGTNEKSIEGRNSKNEKIRSGDASVQNVGIEKSDEGTLPVSSLKDTRIYEEDATKDRHYTETNNRGSVKGQQVNRKNRKKSKYKKKQEQTGQLCK
ncbi:MAG: hypothetical protein LUG99_22490 [Lachnospiraceae bacterium]|nr:hypothetical protein [Lachnospiraceae bacterium]